MNTTKRRLAAIIATGALVAGGLMLGASAANADAIPGATIKLYAQGSNATTDQSKVVTSGSSTANPMFYGIAIDQICPSGHRAGASVQVAQNNVRKGNLGTLIDPVNDPDQGIAGLLPSETHIAIDESFTTSINPWVVNNKSLEAVPGLVSGPVEIRYYCYSDTQNIDFVADPYFSLTINYDATAHTWSVAGPPPVVTPTTLSVSATGHPDNTVSLLADVKVDGVNTAVPGAWELFLNGLSQGVVTLASGEFTGDTDPFENGTYVFKFVFTPTDTAAFSGSTGQASVQFGVDGSPASSTITVTIPNNVGKLTLSGVPTSVPLGTAALVDGALQASGNLTGVTVTDTRQLDFPAWSLTGQVGDFTSGAHTLLGKYLGWTPHVTSGASTSAAGAAVAPAPTSPSGISVVSPFGSGHPTDGQTVTVFDAPLLLKAPSNTPAGDYSATLTITLA